MSRSIPRPAVRYVQNNLRELGLYSGAIDGIRIVRNGQSQTDRGIDQALEQRAEELKLKAGESSFQVWTGNRRAIGYFQLLANDDGLEPGPADGFWGPRTDAAYDTIRGRLPEGWREEQENNTAFQPLLLGYANPYRFPIETPGEMREFYGEPGRPDMVRIRVPYDHKLAWDLPTVMTHISCHRKLAEPLLAAKERVRDHYGIDEIKQRRFDHWGGIFSDRNKRGGRQKSTHAYAGAEDTNPLQNRLRQLWAQSAFGGDPDNHDYVRFYHEQGILNLAAARNFDAMHFQGAVPTQVADFYLGQ